MTRAWLATLILVVPSFTSAQPAVFNVGDFGARPGKVADAAPVINRAIAAAQAVAGRDGGAVVVLPANPLPYYLGSPILLGGRSVTLRGEGDGTILAPLPGYGGPMVCYGLPAGPITPDHRPDAFGVLDESVATQRGKAWGVSTRGDTTLLFQNHALQLGGVHPDYQSITPDYWVRTPVLTLEFCLAIPAHSRNPGTVILGLFDGTNPAPYAVFLSDDPSKLHLVFRTNDVTESRGWFNSIIPIGNTENAVRVTLQVDLPGARVAAWVDGSAVEVVTGAATASPWVADPGRRFAPNDGCTPWMLGAVGSVPINGQPVTDLTLYGLSVARGAKYVWGVAHEVLAASPNAPVNDYARYVQFASSSLADNLTVATLVLTDGPPDLSSPPWVRSNVLGRSTLGHLIPNRRDTTAKGCVISDIQIRGDYQPVILLAQHLGVRIERVTATRALQGIGSLSLVANYPVKLSDCSLDGEDCAYFGFRQTVTARDMTIVRGGRDVIRLVGGDVSWTDTFVGDTGKGTETVVNVLTDGNPAVTRYTRLTVDNEGGGPSRAVVELNQSYSFDTVGTFDGLHVAGVPDGAVLFRLVGKGNADGWRGARFAARALVVDTGSGGRGAVEAVGVKAWSGSVDTAGLPNPSLLGGNAAAGLKVQPAGGN